MMETFSARNEKNSIPSPFPGKFSKLTLSEIHFNELAFIKTERSKWKLVAAGLMVLNFMLVLTINLILPLRTVSIYRLEVDELGAQKIIPMKVQAYTPNDNEIRARLKELSVKMFSLDSKLSSSNFRIVEKFMAGQARKQFTEFLYAERPFARLAEYKDLFREVKVRAVNRLQERVFLVDLETRERIGKSDSILKRWSITFQYEIKPAKSDDEVLGDNPAGIYITNFSTSEISSH